MIRRNQWITIVFAVLVMFGCGGGKPEDYGGFYTVGGRLMVGIKGADGKRYYVLAEDTWLCEGGTCALQAKSCPTCGPCNCTLKVCSPWCFTNPTNEQTKLDPSQFPPR